MGAGLVREVKAKPSMPEWRRDSDSGTAFALKLMPAGSKAILASGGGVTEPEAGTPHIEAAQTPKPAPLQPAIAGAPTTPLTLPPTTDFIGAGCSEKTHLQRPDTKIATVIAPLSRPAGAALKELIAATDWLPRRPKLRSRESYRSDSIRRASPTQRCFGRSSGTRSRCRRPRKARQGVASPPLRLFAEFLPTSRRETEFGSSETPRPFRPGGRAKAPTIAPQTRTAPLNRRKYRVYSTPR